MTVPTTITMGNASVALKALTEAIDRGETAFDLGAVDHSDSSAVAVVLAASRYAQQTGKTVGFTRLPPSMTSLARLYGVDGLMRIGAAAAA